MENIENNNAVDYIPNRNEIGVIAEPRFSLNRNLTVNLAHQIPLSEQLSHTSAVNNSANFEPEVVVNIEPSLPNFLQNLSIQSEVGVDLFACGSIDNSATNPFHAVDLNDISITIEEPAMKQEFEELISSPNTTLNPFIFAENQLKSKSTIDSLIQNRIDELAATTSFSTMHDRAETLSETSSASEKSNLDINSVEEALRALDFAISGGEDSLMAYDNDSSESSDDIDEGHCDDVEHPLNILENDSNHFQDVLRQFLINNGATLQDTAIVAESNSASEFDVPKVSQIYDNQQNHRDTKLIENVQKEAKQLVDSILDECQCIVNQNQNEIKQSSYNVIENTTSNTKYSLYNEQESSEKPEQIFFLNTENKCNETVINLSLHVEETNEIICEEAKNPIQDEDHNIDSELNGNEFFDDLGMISSTPVIAHKFATSASSTTVPLDNKVSAQKNIFTDLHDDDSFKAAISQGIAIINDDSFDVAILNETYDAEVANNEFAVGYATFNCKADNGTYLNNNDNVANNTFSTNKTFTTDPVEPIPPNEQNTTFNKNDTFDLTVKDKTSNDTFLENETFTSPMSMDASPPIQNTTFNKNENFDSTVTIVGKSNCPTIRIDKDEILSADLSTVTPVNTPIELNYSIDSWDKFMSNTRPTESVQTLDLDQPCTSAQAAAASSGWFLHPQTSSAPINSTYEMKSDDDEDDYENESQANLNLTFDALRKQLAKALPHAQGVAGPPEFTDYYDDDDPDTKYIVDFVKFFKQK